MVKMNREVNEGLHVLPHKTSSKSQGGDILNYDRRQQSQNIPIQP